MSGVGQWRVELMSMSEYQQGWDACLLAVGANKVGAKPALATVDADMAWDLGWDDCIDEHTIRQGEP